MKMPKTWKAISGLVAVVFLGNQMFALLFGFTPIPSLTNENALGQWVVGTVALILCGLITMFDPD